MLTSGQLLAERYRLARRIAVGGMGEVWEAADTRLDRKVAVKVLKPELSGDAEFLHRFRTEARTTASLNHPGIAAVHDYGETASIVDGPQDTAYLVMELVEGDPLATIVAKEGRLSPDRTLDILEQAGHALQAAHERGYVHRDVKPGNILITTTADGRAMVKLTDFGIAKAADAAPVTRSGMVMGTAHYIAPEQALGSEAEPASDVYSLAVVGYECLTGHRPFLSENAVTVAMMHIRDLAPPLPPDVPPGARAVIETTMVKDPRQRYGSGGEFAAAVAAVRAGLPLPAPSGISLHARSPLATGTHPGLLPVRPPTGSGPFAPAPPSRGRTGLWVTIAILAVALIVALAVGLPAIFRSNENQTPPGDSRPNGGGDSQSEDAGTKPGIPVPSRSTRPPDDDTWVTINADTYRKLPADEAADLLGQERLLVSMVTDSGGLPTDPRNCLVTDVKPTGRIERDAVVTIVCRQMNGTPG